MNDAVSFFDQLKDKRFTRREVLKGAAVAGAAVGLGPLLAACGGSPSASPSASASAVPKKGGVLRVGLTGGSSSDTLDPLFPVTQPDWARVLQVYEPLLAYDEQAKITPLLAEEMTSNADATVWTIRLRPDVTWTNGKDLTPEDVIYSLRLILDPKTAAAGASLISLVDPRRLKKLDAHTLQVGCSGPFSTFQEAVCTIGYVPVVPEGFEPKNAAKNPVGTGPFEIVSFAPGQQTKLKRNPNYWQTGLPYVDTLVQTNYPDETSQSNALISGQVDVINLVETTDIGKLESQAGKCSSLEGADGRRSPCGWTAAVQRRAGPPGDASARRPQADARPGVQGQRHHRQRRHLALGSGLRHLHPAARAGHRAGQVAAQGGRHEDLTVELV